MPLLLQGTAMVLRDSFVPSQVLVDAHGFQARVFAGVPYMFNYLAANSPADDWPSCLQLLISAGARLDAQTAQAFHDRFGIKIHSFYGASETGGIAYDASDALMADGQVGTAMPGVTISLRPDDEAAEGSGRVFVRSDSVATGYTEDDEESAFVDGGFLTGDLGFVDGRGQSDADWPRVPGCERGRPQGPSRRGRARAAEHERRRRRVRDRGARPSTGAADSRVHHQPAALERARGAPVLRRASCAAQSTARDYFSAVAARSRRAEKSIAHGCCHWHWSASMTRAGKADVLYSRLQMNVWKPVELLRQHSRESSMARFSRRQSSIQEPDISTCLGAGATAEEPRAHATATWLAPHDRFAVPCLRARNPRARPLGRAVARIAGRRPHR